MPDFAHQSYNFSIANLFLSYYKSGDIAMFQVIEQGEDEVVRVEKDFQLVLHKISEVSQAEGPDCLNGDFVKVWNKPFR